MREIVSPLAGIRSPFGQLSSPLAIYAVLGIKPQLVFDFDDEKYFTGSSRTDFTSAITHSRTSNATQVDSDGLLKWGPHNLLTQSENLSLATGSTITVSSDQAVAPDGANTADLIYPTASAAWALKYYAGVMSADIQYTLSMFVKSAGFDWFYLGRDNNTSRAAWFNVSSGSLGTKGAEVTSYAITDVGGGWYKCSVTLTHTAAPLFVFGLSDADNAGTVTADGTSGLFVWGAHVYRSDLGGMVAVPADAQAFSGADSYVPTTSSARYLPRRGHHVWNGSAWVNEGVLHESEARTNIALYSNDISNTAVGWLANNTTTAPATGITGIDGVSGSPFKLISGVNNNVRTNNNNVVSGQDYAICAILKDAGDGVYAVFAGLGISADSEDVIFDLATGNYYTAGTTNTVKEAGMFPWNGDGWYFCWARVTASGTAGVSIGISNSTTNHAAAYTSYAVSGNGFYVAYVGCEQTSGMPSVMPIPNAGATSGAIRAAETLTIPAANLPWPTPNVIGPELVTNGTFDTDTSGWTGNGSPIISWDSGQIKVESHIGSGANPSAYQSFGTTVGAVYRVEVFIDASSSVNATVNKSDTTSMYGTNYFTISSTRGITSEAYFVATASTTFIHIGLSIGSGSAAFILADNISVREIDPLAVSIQMQGKMTYADTDVAVEAIFHRWLFDGNNQIQARLDTASTDTGQVQFYSIANTVVDVVESSATAYSPGVNVPFNIASRHGSTFVNGAVDGAALTVNPTPTALPNLSATDLNLGYDYMGTIKLFRIWAADLADAGIAEAST